MTTTNEKNIIDGPSKMELMLALFDRNTRHDRPVQFTFLACVGEKNERASIVIDGVDNEADTIESWFFRGHVESKPWEPVRKVSGWYQTDKRKGAIVFE